MDDKFSHFNGVLHCQKCSKPLRSGCNDGWRCDNCIIKNHDNILQRVL